MLKKRQQVAQSRSLAEEAYTSLKRQIIRCELQPGVYVTEGQLVQQTGIGKTPIREALGRLAQDGLVRNIPRHGYQISAITVGDVQELFRLRLIIEPAAVQLAVGHVDVVQLRRLDELCRAGYAPGDHESIDSFLQANHEFHVTVAEAAGNRRLTSILVRLLEESNRFFHLALMLCNRSEEMSHEHADLVTALLEGDSEAARHIAVDQIVAAQRMVLDALLSSPAVLSAEVTAPATVIQELSQRRGKRPSPAPSRKKRALAS